MTDILKQLVTAILPVVPYLFVLLVLFILFVLVYLFIAFKNAPEKTAKAILAEMAALGKFRKLVFTRKDDVVIAGANGPTIVKPRLSDTSILEATADPRIKPDGEEFKS